jgi:alanine racemase
MTLPDGAHTWIEVSRSALLHNLETLRRHSGGALVAPVIKANAYGHGLELVAGVLAAAGVPRLCLNELEEASRLRALGLTLPLYVLGPTLPSDSPRVAALGCEVVVSSWAQLTALSAAGAAVGRPIGVHLKVETGTHRQGVPPAEIRSHLERLPELPGVRLVGLTTHLADVEDETESSFARVQLAAFDEVAASLPPGVLRHVAASAGELLIPEARYDMVRPGIALYGLWPSEKTRIASELLGERTATAPPIELKPAMRWMTRVMQLRDAEKGAWVGYGRTSRLARATRLALLPVGYYDGWDRGLSGQGVVAIRGRLAPVVGRVAMNMTVVDVTDLPVAEGDPVLLLGPDHDETTADRVAERLGTIHYEVTTRIEARHPRLLVD